MKTTDMDHIYKAIDIAKQANQEITWQLLFDAHSRKWECHHEENSPRFSMTSNGNKTYGMQCQHCGKWFRKRKDYFGWKLPDVEFCQKLKNAYTEQRTESIKKVSVVWQEIRQYNKVQEDSEWWQRYYEYMESEEWKQKRQLVLSRDKNTCQGCLSAEAEEVHHLSYDNMGNEMLFELISLCHDCHNKVHRKNESGVDLSGIAI